MATFNTAELPLGIAAGATHEQLTSSSNGSPVFTDHRLSSPRTILGSRASQALRSTLFWHAEASRSGIITAPDFIEETGP
jgi:hypothetical protein